MLNFFGLFKKNELGSSKPGAFGLRFLSVPGALLICFIPFLGFMLGYAGGFFYFQTQTQDVPNLIGKNLHSAIETASAKQLSLRLLQEKEDPFLPEGTIVQQIPRAFQKTRLNQSIFVIISKRTAPSTAPNLLHENRSDIAFQLPKLGITQKVIMFADGRASDTCVAQSPLQGEPLQNQKVICYMSAGMQNLFIMPNLKGVNVSDLQVLAKNKNITLEVYDSAGSMVNISPEADLPSYVVTEQKPISGSIINLDKPIHIQVLVS